MGRPYGILVVDDNVATLKGLLQLLRNAGYRVTAAADAETATRLLSAIPFDLLIVDIYLRKENGLALLQLARQQQPAMATIVITGFPDPDVDQEAHRLGAEYVVKPLDPKHLLEIVAERVSGVSKERRWPRKPVAGGFGAKLGDAPARVVEMSYGGVRFEMPMPPDGELPSSIQLRLLPFGLVINAEMIWSSHGTENLTCGAALSESDWRIAHAWRTVVDALAKTANDTTNGPNGSV
jgi:CheY-like chemotaxis protein